MALVADGEAPKEPNENAFESPSAQVLREQTGAIRERSSYFGSVHYVLHFLSTASNEKLGACALALGLTTYLVLGRVGLVLIGMIVGIVLHAAWEGYTDKRRDDRFSDKGGKRKKDEALDRVARVLDWKLSDGVPDEGDIQGNTNDDSLRTSERWEDFSDFRPATRTAMGRLVDAVICDYVQ